MANTHEHKFYGYQVKADFEPLPPFMEESADGELVNTNQDLYRRVEYAISICNCGAARKVKVNEEV
jgi:hypothetical protein